MGGIFIPDPSRPHLRYPWDFIREAKMQILKRWDMTMATRQDIETAHQHLIVQVRLHKAEAIRRLECGDRDWNGLRRVMESYIQFQTGADVMSGQTPLDRTNGST